jgi:menaquinone-dependent protoporphyrinogen IX oxidase
MKAIAIYTSKTGFTKKYAQWIAHDLLAYIFKISKVNINMLTAYDTIIYGGSLYSVVLIEWIQL